MVFGFVSRFLFVALVWFVCACVVISLFLVLGRFVIWWAGSFWVTCVFVWVFWWGFAMLEIDFGLFVPVFAQIGCR